MVTILISLLGLGMLSKIFKVIKDISITILSVIFSLIGILLFFKLLYKWVLVPIAKGVKSLTKAICLFFQWLSIKIDKHFAYRNDNTYWIIPNK